MTDQHDLFGADATQDKNAGRLWSLKQRRSPRHSNTCRRVLRIGQMAWEGRSAGEIADEIGVSVMYVYHLCSFYRIKLSTKTRAEYAFRVTIKLSELSNLERLAASHDTGVELLCSNILGAVSHETTLVSNLLEAGE